MSNETEENKDTPLEKERKEQQRQSMLKAHINAYIKRAMNAGIPERYLRIGPDQFKNYFLRSIMA